MSHPTDSTQISKKGISVIMGNPKTHPNCPHGPTLLFSRENEKVNRQFFACSACRDRKLCGFFMWADELEKTTKHKLDQWERERIKFLKGIDHRKLFILFNKVKNLPIQKRNYCKTCDTFTIDNKSKHHPGHSFLTNITDYQLNHPTELLPPLENSKKEAQYLFAKSSIKILVDIFQELKYRNIICIGTPRIHEYIQSECKNMSSILLDIDRRYHSFFGPLQFCWYNSFNNHFFFEEAHEVFKEFLRSTEGESTVLITDPPFGGRIEPLTHTFSTIGNQYKKLSKDRKDLPIFWIYPYFMEPQILNSLPDFHMLDYKVEYDNHPLFQSGPKGRKQGSPVRIFTNVSPSLIKLPEDSYKFCKLCVKWVSKENSHCRICQSCTSKNGETYIHCIICQRCVKPNWRHCNDCNRCAQVTHKCENIVFTGVCLNCKVLGHKKSECPQLQIKNINKRKKKYGSAQRKKLKC